jgi:hypothetical protein
VHSPASEKLSCARGAQRRIVWFAASIAVVALVAVFAGGAYGAITAPGTNPFTVPGDAAGNPIPFTITANGFAPGTPVLVEQCDGVPSTSAGWNPNLHCDLGTSPSSVLPDANGVATFTAGDPNHQFVPIKGESPSSFFNCIGPTDPPLMPTNGLTDYKNCQLRVSSNNSAVTADQQFLTMTLPNSTAATTTTSVPVTTTAPATTTTTTVAHATTTTVAHATTTTVAHATTTTVAHATTTTSVPATTTTSVPATTTTSTVAAEGTTVTSTTVFVEDSGTAVDISGTTSGSSNGGSLPFTGSSSSLPLVALALVLMGLGLALAVGRRRVH